MICNSGHAGEEGALAAFKKMVYGGGGITKAAASVVPESQTTAKSKVL